MPIVIENLAYLLQMPNLKVDGGSPYWPGEFEHDQSLAHIDLDLGCVSEPIGAYFSGLLDQDE